MLYDISINPPILSFLTIVFMICMEVLLFIYGDSDYQELHKSNNKKEQILILLKIFIKALVFAFLLLNIIILYTKL